MPGPKALELGYALLVKAYLVDKCRNHGFQKLMANAIGPGE